VRIGLGLRMGAAGAAFLGCTSQRALSRTPSPAGRGPMNDIAVSLSSGTVVRIRNIMIFQNQNGSRLTVYVETPTPSTEPERLALEAKEIAELQLKSPTIGSLNSVGVAVCRTDACVEMREKPEELFLFDRKSDGSVEAVKQPSPAPADANAPLMRIASIFLGEWREPVCSSEPPAGETIWFAGGDYCEWTSPTRGRIVAQRDGQHGVHVVILNKQTDNEADAHGILGSLATGLRSFGLSERECAPGSSPAGAVRSWLYHEPNGVTIHVSEITPTGGQPRLMAMAVDMPDSFLRTLCH
jgi:hypothetical protein